MQPHQPISQKIIGANSNVKTNFIWSCLHPENSAFQLTFVNAEIFFRQTSTVFLDFKLFFLLQILFGACSSPLKKRTVIGKSLFCVSSYFLLSSLPSHSSWALTATAASTYPIRQELVLHDISACQSNIFFFFLIKCWHTQVHLKFIC